jgi:hypothetical protein
MENINEIEEDFKKSLLRLKEKESNSQKVVDRYLRMRLKRRIRYFTGIRIK